VRLTDPFQAVTLNQIDNPAKPGFHVDRQTLYLFPNAVVRELKVRGLLSGIAPLNPIVHGPDRVNQGRPGWKKSDYCETRPLFASASVTPLDSRIEPVIASRLMRALW